MSIIRIKLAAALLLVTCSAAADDKQLRLATFNVDVTPPLGAPLCDSFCPPASEIVDPLSARGIVLVADEKPIVMCAVDWVGIGNGAYDAWRNAIAQAAGTSAHRVAVHCLHQHDAPGCDFDAEEVLAHNGLSGACFHVAFAHQAIERVAEAVRKAKDEAGIVTHIGLGVGRVEGVASNRRVMGPDGKVKYVRYSSCKDEKIRAEPEGVIDPDCRLISFFNGDKPLASITFYATHPQSYYGAGGVSADFPGMARSLREKAMPGVPQIHFNGASGNVTAGKYNDGSHEMRPILAERLAAGMQNAWEHKKLTPVTAADVDWRTVEVALPPRDALDAAQLTATLGDSQADARERVRAARDLAWLWRCRSGHKIELTCLKLGPAFIVGMPGELFIEYQLAAEKLKPDALVCLAAYGDYGPGYIGTSIAYTQGGYETSRVSRVGPEVEGVLMGAMKELLK
jgi:hypothetical protein